jgi:glycosyltransferase involved in cell wall biosynthesis
VPERVPPGGYYLSVGQLVPYKRVDLAVEAAKRLGRPLVVIGEGPERGRLEALAGPGTTFLGWQDDAAVRRHYAACRALLFPGEEDFGIVPVEAQMAGRPVIAYRKGGATETVVDGRTGLFFDRPDADALAEAMRELEKREGDFRPEDARAGALRFSTEAFVNAFAAFLGRL